MIIATTVINCMLIFELATEVRSNKVKKLSYCICIIAIIFFFTTFLFTATFEDKYPFPTFYIESTRLLLGLKEFIYLE